MKIIGKPKDYYDYLVGIYGIDNKVILDRRKSFRIDPLTKVRKITLHICGKKIEGLWLNGTCYYLDDLAQVCKKEKKGPWYYDDKEAGWHWAYGEGSDGIGITPTIIDSPLNDKLDCPILIKISEYEQSINQEVSVNSYIENRFNRYKEFYGKFPHLATLQLGSVFPPEQIYTMLYNWMIKTIDLPNKQTSKEKIVSHGFDLKHSFRNTK